VFLSLFNEQLELNQRLCWRQ